MWKSTRARLLSRLCALWPSHHVNFIFHLLSYISCTRQGLSQAEVLGVLNRDESVLKEVSVKHMRALDRAMLRVSLPFFP